MNPSSSAERKAARALEANKRKIGKTKAGTPGAATLERRQKLRGRHRDRH